MIDLNKLSVWELQDVARAANVVRGINPTKDTLIARIMAVYNLGDYRSRIIEAEVAQIAARKPSLKKAGTIDEKKEVKQMEVGFHQCKACSRWFKIDFDFCPKCGTRRER